MREEVDKLARGLVREELRLLSKRLPERLEKGFSDLVRPNGVSYYNNGSLGETKQKGLRRKLVTSLMDELGGFGHSISSARLEETGSRTPQDTLFFWEPTLMNVTNTDERLADRHETYLDLKHANVSVGRKKIVADWRSSFVLVNEHTLYRMIQRGLVSREPLRYLSQHINEWFRYVSVFSLIHHLSGKDFGHNLFIPFGGGALLAKMSFTQTETSPYGWGFHNMRFVDGIKSSKVVASPYEPLTTTTFDGVDGAASVCISTWIPQEYFHTEQWWAKVKIEEFVKNYSVLIDFCRRAMTASGNLANPVEVKIMKEQSDAFTNDLNAILRDRRWAIACNW